MSKSLVLITSIILITNSFVAAQNVPVKFDGQIRMRSETDGRDFNSDSDINSYTLLRTRFGAAVQPTGDVNVYIQLQDSRAFGQEASTLANTSNLDVHQAFFQVNNLWNKPIHIKAGRQEIVYGSQRLIGSVGWSNVARSFDGVKLTFGTNSTFDLFSLIINENNTPVSGSATPAATAGRKNTDFQFSGVYYKHRKNSNYTLDIYGLFESNLNETIPSENDLNRITLGSYSKGTFSEHFDFETEVALQLGKRRGQDVSAYMLTGAVGYTLQSARKPYVSIGMDYLSGMNTGDSEYKAFDTLFATNHKFYGYMDYFMNVPVNTNGQGLRDFMFKTKIPFANKWALNAHFHNFRVAKGSEKNLGNELDFILNYKYNAVASFVFGLALFIPGELLEQRFTNSDPGIWSFTTMLVNF